LQKKPDFDVYANIDTYRIHYAMRILMFSGFPWASIYRFDHYLDGPYSQNLEADLEALDWNEVPVAGEIDDERIAITKEAISRGDDFLLALSITLGVANRNSGITRAETLDMVVYIASEVEGVAEAAYDYAEVRIWPK
jgi:hypothetical protein